MELPPMSTKMIQLASTLNQVFICLATCSEGLQQILINQDIKDFPIQNFFLRDSPDFDQSSKR